METPIQTPDTDEQHASNEAEELYRLARDDSESKLGALISHDSGAQEIGFRALRQTVRVMIGRELLSPQNPREKRIVLEHDDGSVDTGSRAVRNTVRIAAGREPKVYKRTFKPLDS